MPQIWPSKVQVSAHSSMAYLQKFKLYPKCKHNKVYTFIKMSCTWFRKNIKILTFQNLDFSSPLNLWSTALTIPHIKFSLTAQYLAGPSLHPGSLPHWCLYASCYLTSWPSKIFLASEIASFGRIWNSQHMIPLL